MVTLEEGESRWVIAYRRRYPEAATVERQRMA